MKKFLAILLAVLLFVPVFGNAKSESPSTKMKGICVHGEDIYKEGAKNVANKIKEFGYNTIFLLVKNPQGQVYYNSNFIPVKYPVLSKTIKAAHSKGIKVFVYFPVFMDKHYGTMHPSERMVKIDGTTNSYYISLLSDSYFQYLKRFISELTLFDIDGITFDYIRFPNGSYDFSDAFLSLAKSKGINVVTVKNIAYKTFVNPANWKSLFYAYDTNDDVRQWVNLRKGIIQSEAYLLKNYIKALNPSLKVGAFIVARGSEYKIGDTDEIDKTFEYEIVNFGQTSDVFSKLDFSAPMVYLNSLKETPAYTISVIKKIKINNTMVYTAVNPYKISAVDTEKELFYSFSFGDGAILFRYPIFEMGSLIIKGNIQPGENIDATVKTSSGGAGNITLHVDNKDFIPAYKNSILVFPFYNYIKTKLYIGKEIGTKTFSPFYKDKTFLMDTAPFIKDSRTFVPVRFVSENLGAKIYWDGNKKEVKVEDNENTIIMIIGNKRIIVNGKTFLMDTAPFIKDSRTFVPVRFVSENLGAKIYWDGSDREVKIEKFIRTE